MDEWHEEIDNRSRHFFGLTPENLAQEAARWPRTGSTPEAVSGLLVEARHLWVGASACYSNFVASSLKALHAAELALRARLEVPDENRITLGGLFREHNVLAALDHDLERYLWFHTFALRFRNDLSHPKSVKAFTPGMAVTFLRTGHEQVAMLYPQKESPWSAAA